MAAPPTLLSTVTYQELADLEAAFEDSNIELLRAQVAREAALYQRRAALVRRIPNFWPLVLEQAPSDIDQYIQATDAAVLLAHLEDLEVVRFGVEGPGADAAAGDPRHLLFRLTFAANDYFEDRVLEKRFFFRTAAPSAPSTSGEAPARPIWEGLVSEPVPIRWKPGKDLTHGLLDAAVAAYARPDDAAATGALRAQLDESSAGSHSFFAWFGYVGRRVTPDESAQAEAEFRARRLAREARRAAGEADKPDDDDDDDDDMAEEEIGYPLEIYEDGEDLAITLAEDLWPNAIKYFGETLEEADSEDGFELDGDDGDDEVPPLKKVRV